MVRLFFSVNTYILWILRSSNALFALRDTLESRTRIMEIFYLPTLLLFCIVFDNFDNPINGDRLAEITRERERERRGLRGLEREREREVHAIITLGYTVYPNGEINYFRTGSGCTIRAHSHLGRLRFARFVWRIRSGA